VAQMLIFSWLDFLTAQALLVCVTPLLHRRTDHQVYYQLLWKRDFQSKRIFLLAIKTEAS
jgi:hypothetical protein